MKLYPRAKKKKNESKDENALAEMVDRGRAENVAAGFESPVLVIGLST